MARINVNANPNILLWAREEAGYSVEEISQKLSIDQIRYESWEANGKEIPLGKLQNVATYYKRQLAVFLMQEVPEKIKKPHDFRNLMLADQPLSKELLLTLRRSIHLQNIAKELEGEYYWKNKLSWLKEVETLNSEAGIIDFIRDILDINIDLQLKWKTDSEAYRNWRTSIEEKLGILVFQFSMPIEEIQGFCLADNYPYVIVTNSNHSYTGRIFTLFHELAHILRHQSGMCIVDNVEITQNEEWACNSFAGSFLAPLDTIIPSDNLKSITTNSRKLKISREVYLRRLHSENYINSQQFFDILAEIKATYKNIKKTKGFVLPEVKSKATRGETLYNIIFDGINTNKINYTDAAHALDLRINRLINAI
jgi:Zn-dependent peptidase ImmA (M78 family)